MSKVLELFVDLDGVMVDFDSMAVKIAGLRPNDATDKKLRSVFWGRINHHIRSGGTFFRDMTPMADAFDLWEYVLKHNPRICSASGNTPGAEAEKRGWVAQHLGQEHSDRAIIVTKASEKALHAHQHAVLIDDRAKSIDPWIAAGGIGILHTSAADTIEQLKKLGL